MCQVPLLISLLSTPRHILHNDEIYQLKLLIYQSLISCLLLKGSSYRLLPAYSGQQFTYFTHSDLVRQNLLSRLSIPSGSQNALCFISITVTYFCALRARVIIVSCCQPAVVFVIVVASSIYDEKGVMQLLIASVLFSLLFPKCSPDLIRASSSLP